MKVKTKKKIRAIKIRRELCRKSENSKKAPTRKDVYGRIIMEG